jgi:hypothetical protein
MSLISFEYIFRGMDSAEVNPDYILATESDHFYSSGTLSLVIKNNNTEEVAVTINDDYYTIQPGEIKSLRNNHLGLATVTCVPYNNVQYLGFHINP